VGSSNRRADRALVAEMSRQFHNESFDEKPLAELNSEVIDFRAASEFFAETRRLKRSDLLTLRLAANISGEPSRQSVGSRSSAETGKSTSQTRGFKVARQERGHTCLCGPLAFGAPNIATEPIELTVLRWTPMPSRRR